MQLEHVKLDMHTRYIPIIGYPMDHSSASYVYNYLFGCRNLNAIMWPLELEKGRLPEFMAARNLFGIDKFTLTMPHKADIIPLLDRVEESAAYLAQSMWYGRRRAGPMDAAATDWGV